MNATIGFYHDTRRAKKDGTYPLKLRVQTTKPKEKRLYVLPYDFTREQFYKAWEVKRTPKDFKTLRNDLQALQVRATEIGRQLVPFTFAAFEKLFFQRSGDNENVLRVIENRMKDLTEAGQLGTADTYRCTLKSIKAFAEHESEREVKRITFHEITSDWLHRYERYMTKTQERSMTTVSIYTRALRALFNHAISQKDIAPEIYPFKKHARENDKYTVPSTRNIKKALSNDNLRTLMNAAPKTPDQDKARAFWFFSYACNGMNIKDVAHLKYSMIKNGGFTFFRAKTVNTAKKNLQPIQVMLNDYALDVIRRYGNSSKDGYVFPIVHEGMTEGEQHRAVKLFTRYINQHLKKLAEANGITTDISTYFARHSFSTQVIRQGGSIEFVQQALGHTDTKTTQNYFAGFEDNSLKQIADKIMDF